ncbi:unnamed protein product [Orchesella dallaii]|uniref:Uncharacterized protein n=1 Tax=Orchesella dallaii TaxID=48710 RepID=A0ABP1RAS1_9HEXA
MSNEVQTFLQNFYHCLFHFHVANTSEEVSNDWNGYDNLLHFYAGISPITILTEASAKLISPEHLISFRKFSSCSVQLHICHQIQQDSSPIGWRREFLWFVFPAHPTNCNIRNVISSNLTILGYPAIFFIIFDFTKVEMLCLSCDPKKRFSNMKEFIGKGIQSFKTLWKRLHTKLDGASIQVNTELTWNEADKWNCNIHKGFYTSEERCTYFLMRKSLNFSKATEDQDQGKTLIHSLILPRRVVDEDNIAMMHNEKFEMISYTMNIQPYAYILVLADHHSSINIEAIVQPFDWATWINLIICILMLVVIMSTELRNKSLCGFYKNGIMNIIPIFTICFSTVSLLVDQPASNLSQLMKKNPISIFICWLVWSVSAVTLGQFYKGTLYSFLSNIPSPLVPDGLPNILKAHISITTQSIIWYESFINGTLRFTPSSTLKDGILSEMLGTKRETDKSIYGELYRRLEWVGENNGEITLQLLKNNSKIFNKFNNQTFKIPRSFFVMDRNAQVERFRMELIFFTKKWVSNVQHLPLFMYRNGWLIKENYLLDILKMKLAQLFESGLIDRWKNCWDKHLTVTYIKKTSQALDCRGGGLKEEKKKLQADSISDENNCCHKGNRNGNIAPINIFQYVYLSEQKPPTSASDSELLPFKVYLLIVLYTFVCLVFSIVVLLFEVLMNL